MKLFLDLLNQTRHESCTRFLAPVGSFDAGIDIGFYCSLNVELLLCAFFVFFDGGNRIGGDLGINQDLIGICLSFRLAFFSRIRDRIGTLLIVFIESAILKDAN